MVESIFYLQFGLDNKITLGNISVCRLVFDCLRSSNLLLDIVRLCDFVQFQIPELLFVDVDLQLS